MNEKSVRPFGVKDQLGYVFGDMAGSFVNLFVDAYFLTFCTYILGISPGWMAGLFLAARLWDAINDPIMGSFPDRWLIGKSGDKFKPWVKLFMIPLALSGVLCFTKVPFEGIALHAWVAFSYVLYGMCYTGTSMPFGAMASVVSTDPIDRSKLSRARSIGGTLVGFGALSIIPVVCFDKESNILPERFTMVAIVFGGMPISGGARSKIYAAVVGGFSYIVLNNILDLLIDSTSGYGITQIVSAVFFLIIVYVASVNYRSQTLPR